MIVKIGFGGGCHWCTEAVFQSLNGVENVDQGFISSDQPYNEYSEGVSIDFDESVISELVLIEIHLRTHASGSLHKMRGKYRSAIYYFNDQQKQRCIKILAKLQKNFDTERVTQILPFRTFKASDERFQNYYEKGPERPFCQNYIDPKLKILRNAYSKHYRSL